MLNLPSGKATSVISDIASGISQLRQQMQGLRQDTGGWVNVLGSATSKMGGASGAGTNQVAPYPKFSVDSDGVVNYQGTTSGNKGLVFNQNALQPYVNPTYTVPPNTPRGGGGGGGDYKSVMAAGAVGGIQAMPGTKEAVDYQLALSRMVFYQQTPNATAGSGSIFSALGIGKGDPGRAGARQAAEKLMSAGTATNKFDAVNAYATAAQYGLGGPNMQQMMMGNAAMSNITPGIGLEGATRAYGAVQQGRSVNMLRGIGIRIRGEDGSMKPMPQIIDELWRKINREKIGGGALSVEDVRISLQPGNALASMLDQYFGGDPLLRKQVEDGLIFKARTGGGAIKSGADGKRAAEAVGATTAAVSSLSNRTAEASKTLGQTADAQSAAFTQGNNVIKTITGIVNLFDRIAGVLKLSGVFKSFGDTLASAGNFAFAGPAGVVSALGGLFKAEGGPVAGKSPYIVGERGPELFVPKTDGQIIPNHSLANYPFRDNGGGVKAGGYGLGEKSSPEEWAKAMLKALGAPIKEDSIDALKMWARFEGGHFSNGGTHAARYNPLNTKYTMDGSFKATKFGVQGYQNWEQGVNAAVKTLTGNRADERGYSAIVESLRKGADKDSILAAINQSAWVNGENKASNYKFAGSSSKYDVKFNEGGGSKGVFNSDSGRVTMRSLLEKDPDSTKSMLSTLTKGMGEFAKTASASTGHTYNYGGVSIKIDGSSNPNDTVAALKAALTSQDTISKAAKS